MKKKKQKGRAGDVIMAMFFVAIGAVCGYASGKYFDLSAPGQEGSLTGWLLGLGLTVLCLVAGIYLQLILHEGGHLVFGLLTGYRFLSFRIGSLMWMKKDGRIVRARMRMAGTGGQCLLAPPAGWESRPLAEVPVGLYNMGGALMNLITAGIALALLFAVDNRYLTGILLIFAVSGIGIALTNGLPLRLSLVNNDGSNMVDVMRSEAAKRAFLLQMTVAEAQTAGKRLRDMPDAWFEMPEEDGLQNSLIVTLAVLRENRLLEQHRFEEADALAEKLLTGDYAIPGIYKMLLTGDAAYCELMTGQPGTRVEMLHGAEFEKNRKAMASFPSVFRTDYAAAILAGDRAEAEKQTAQFEKLAKHYPYSADLENEQELMELARAKAERGNLQ